MKFGGFKIKFIDKNIVILFRFEQKTQIGILDFFCLYQI